MKERKKERKKERQKHRNGRKEKNKKGKKKERQNTEMKERKERKKKYYNWGFWEGPVMSLNVVKDSNFLKNKVAVKTNFQKKLFLIKLSKFFLHPIRKDSIS